jgi:hypothetical protein
VGLIGFLYLPRPYPMNEYNGILLEDTFRNDLAPPWFSEDPLFLQ